MQSEIGTPKIDRPKIDAFSSFEHYENAPIFGEGLYIDKIILYYSILIVVIWIIMII